MKSPLILAVLLLANVQAYVVKPTPKGKPATDLKKAAVGAFAAITLATNSLNVPAAGAADFSFSSSNIIAETVTRQGVYREYDVEVTEQAYDDAESTFKSAKETKSKKGKYTALLAVLVVGSFIIPMAQYFWYVRDDDSSDRFFAEDVPEPPKKKGWF